MQAAPNPILELPAMQRLLREITPGARVQLEAVLRELGEEADRRAEDSWKHRKGPMAAYWRAVGVYARYTARGLKQGLRAVRRVA